MARLPLAGQSNLVLFKFYDKLVLIFLGFPDSVVVLFKMY